MSQHGSNERWRRRMNSPARRRSPYRHDLCRRRAAERESHVRFDVITDVIGPPRCRIWNLTLADGTRSDSRAAAANSRLALNPFRAPPFESARSREVGNDVMRVTPMPEAARCSLCLGE